MSRLSPKRSNIDHVPLCPHTPEFVCLVEAFLRSCPALSRFPVPFRGDTQDTEHEAFLKSLMPGQIPKLTLLLPFSSCVLLEITIPHSGLKSSILRWGFHILPSSVIKRLGIKVVFLGGVLFIMAQRVQKSRQDGKQAPDLEESGVFCH